jgi:hypothetical protein
MRSFENFKHRSPRIKRLLESNKGFYPVKSTILSTEKQHNSDPRLYYWGHNDDFEKTDYTWNEFTKTFKYYPNPHTNIPTIIRRNVKTLEQARNMVYNHWKKENKI